jgi:hypothetical protein
MKKYFFLAFIILAFVYNANAQGTPPPPDGGSGPGTVDDVSINFLIYPYMLLGAYLGARFFSKFKK